VRCSSTARPDRRPTRWPHGSRPTTRHLGRRASLPLSLSFRTGRTSAVRGGVALAAAPSAMRSRAPLRPGARSWAKALARDHTRGRVLAWQSASRPRASQASKRDRGLSAGASRPCGPWLAFSTDADSALCRGAVGGIRPLAGPSERARRWRRDRCRVWTCRDLSYLGWSGCWMKLPVAVSGVRCASWGRYSSRNTRATSSWREDTSVFSNRLLMWSWTV
jgi:hypothetical protein